jgi:hypothetical protein
MIGELTLENEADPGTEPPASLRADQPESLIAPSSWPLDPIRSIVGLLQ